MGNSLSTPEKIVKYVKQNDAAKLQQLLSLLESHNREYQRNRAAFLEVEDGIGSTPLILGAQRGSYQCVALLLRQGANLHKVNRRPEGGSALHEAIVHKHGAVAELLLRSGASPFVENIKGYTPMDIACSVRNVDMLRRLEQLAQFKGWLMVKVTRFGGLGSEWQRRWVVICHRLPYPAAPPSRQVVHTVLLQYKKTESTAPSCRVWLDGARAQEVFNPKAIARLHGQGPAQIGVVLHPKHDVPSGAYYTVGQTAREGCMLYFRPDDGSQPSIDSLVRFEQLVNNRGAPPALAVSPTARPQEAPTAEPHAGLRPQPLQPPPRMASLPGVWALGPLAQGVASTIASGESDEDLARRLQAQYDSELAQHLSESARPSASSSAAATPTHAASTIPAARPASQPLYPPILLDSGTSGPLGQVPLVPMSPVAPAPPLATVPSTGAISEAGTARSDQPSAPPMPVGMPGGRPATSPTHLLDDDSLWASPPAGPSADHIAAPSAASGLASPTHPAAAPSGAPSTAAAGSEEDDEGICAVCMEAPSTSGFLHGETVHKCCCKQCAQYLRDQNVRTCPMCRLPIEGYIMNVF